MAYYGYHLDSVSVGSGPVALIAMILVPEMTVQNYAALAALLRDAAETIVTDVKTEITLVTHNELETVYTYTIVGTVSAEDIFECELTTQRTALT